MGGEYWKAALTDQLVEEGALYPESHSRRPDGSLSPGFNSYEACLRFAEGNRTTYYAGGAGEMESVQEVLGCFKQLVWMERVEDPDGLTFIKVREVLATYVIKENNDAAG
jgi:hypothetical protein